MRDIVLIPSLNPDEKLITLAKEIFDDGSLTLVVVNDGSPEEYDSIFDSLREYGTVIGYRTNMGKGHALKYGFEYIKNTYGDEDYSVITMDSDGQHTLVDAKRILEESHQNKNTLILGSRKLDKSCPLRSRMGNWMARTLFFLFAHKKVYDTQTGLRAFGSDLIDLIMSSKGERYEYEMNMILDCVRNKVEIKEIDIAVIYIDNNSGSHYNPFRDTAKILFQMVKFSLSSLIGFLVDWSCYSLLLFIPVTSEYWLVGCNVIARVISATVNFSINYNLVFKKRETLWKSALKYTVLALFILGCNTGILWLLVKQAGINEYLAKVIVEAIMFVVSFLVQRFFVFVSKKKETK